MSKNSHKINTELIRMQEREYTPLLKCTKFVGGYFFSSCIVNNFSSNWICQTLYPTDKEKDPMLAYGISLVGDANDLRNKTIKPRTYEVHFEYSGKYDIRRFNINSIAFLDGDRVLKEWSIPDNSDEISLYDKQEIPILINIFDQHRNLIDAIKNASKIRLYIEMVCFDGSKYLEEMVITKHIVNDRIPSINKDEGELMLSVGYSVNRL